MEPSPLSTLAHSSSLQGQAPNSVIPAPTEEIDAASRGLADLSAGMGGSGPPADVALNQANASKEPAPFAASDNGQSRSEPQVHNKTSHSGASQSRRSTSPDGQGQPLQQSQGSQPGGPSPPSVGMPQGAHAFASNDSPGGHGQSPLQHAIPPQTHYGASPLSHGPHDPSSGLPPHPQAPAQAQSPPPQHPQQPPLIGQNQQQAAAAAAQAQSQAQAQAQAGAYRPLNVRDALSYLDQVKVSWTFAT